MMRKYIFALFILICFLTTVCFASGLAEDTGLSAFRAENIVWTEDEEHFSFNQRYPTAEPELRYSGTARCLVVPSALNGVAVTKIGSLDDYPGLLELEISSSVEAIRFSEGITELGRNALWHAESLRYVEIPSSVTTIRGDAFSRCIGLKEVTIPATVTFIENYAFSGNTTLFHVWQGSAAEAYCIRNNFTFSYVSGTETNVPYDVGTQFNPIDEHDVYAQLPDGTRIAFPRETTRWSGADFLLDTPVPDKDYTIQMKMNGTYPDRNEKEIGRESSAYPDHYDSIYIRQQNGLFSVDKKTEDVYSKANRAYSGGIATYWTGTFRDSAGRIHIHIDLMNGVQQKETDPIKLEIWYFEGDASYLLGEMLVYSKPEGYEAVPLEELIGGWRLIDSSDGKPRDDMYITENEVIFRRHDLQGAPYYAPREITRKEDSHITGTYFDWYFYRSGNHYFVRDEKGVTLTFEKTDETRADYEITELAAGTPSFVSLFNHDWHNYDDEFQISTDAYYRFYEDTVVYHGIGSGQPSRKKIEYNGNHFTWYNLNDGTVSYEADWAPTPGSTRVWLAMTDETGRTIRLYWHGSAGEGEYLSLPTPTPTPAVFGGTPEKLDPALWKNRTDFARFDAFSGNKNKISDGFKMARLLPQYGDYDQAPFNHIGQLHYNSSNAMFQLQNSEDFPIRFRFYLYGNYNSSKGEKPYYIRFFDSNRKQIGQIDIPDQTQKFRAVYTKQVQPGEKFYFNMNRTGENKYGHIYDVMIVRDAFDSSSMRDEFYVEVLEPNTPVPDPVLPGNAWEAETAPIASVTPAATEIQHVESLSTAEPVMTDISPVVIQITPEPSAGSESSDEPARETEAGDKGDTEKILIGNESVRIELNWDGSGRVTEIFPEGEEQQDITWQLDGQFLRINSSKRYGYSTDIRLTGDLTTVEIDGAHAEVTLPDSLPESIRVYFDGGSADLTGSPVDPAPEWPDYEPEIIQPAAADISVETPGVSSEHQDGAILTVSETEPMTDPEPVPSPVSETSISLPAPAPATPTPLPAFEPVQGRDDVFKLAVASVSATSWIVGKDPNAYIPSNMIDGIETTSFQFSTKTTKLGQEYLYFEFDRPVTVDELWIKNGFWKITEGLDQYTRNSRVKKMTIDYRYDGSNDYRDKKTISLKDDKKRKDWKTIDLGRHENVTGIRILIQDIYKGSKFKTDVCISEIMFVMKNK